ncbi:hypothetical protein RVR_P19 (plasmid) [Actinacidiphila reveromycinica]|uniref:Uncharacterized protein n=1 Tax=Actinacidiphila reveromycinica TaxID=659352 RepID=A0A7R6QHU5_9ACTN|nr:hypothetical protein [Streptomyces sp. SN-593]BBG20640.1 hypothetical protein RVR_P19 [Streptomyces sp. SN-593]
MNPLSQTPTSGGLQQLSGGSAVAAGRSGEVTGVSTGAERGPGGPTEGELRMVRTRNEATRLAVALVKDPFAPETAAAAREFLSGAEAAGEAFAELQALPEHDVRARITELTSRRGEEACS